MLTIIIKLTISVGLICLGLQLCLLPKGTTYKEWLLPDKYSLNFIDDNLYKPFWIWFVPFLNLMGLVFLIYHNLIMLYSNYLKQKIDNRTHQQLIDKFKDEPVK